MATVRSQTSEFEIEHFFHSLQALLGNSLHDNNITFDTAELLYRRLDGYERNISVPLARLRESFPGEEQLLEDLGNLHEIVRQQRKQCETLSFQSLFAEDQQTNRQALTSVTINRNGVGRPTLDVSQELLETLHFQVGFSWSQIARNLGISESTLRRRRRSFQIPSSQQSFSNISDNALHQIVREILHVTPRIGYRLVQGALCYYRVTNYPIVLATNEKIIISITVAIILFCNSLNDFRSGTSADFRHFCVYFRFLSIYIFRSSINFRAFRLVLVSFDYNSWIVLF